MVRGNFAHGTLCKLYIDFGAPKELLRISRASYRGIKLSLFRALFNSSTLASSVILRADSVESGAPSKQIKSVLILVNWLNELWVTCWRSMAVTSHFDLLKMRPKSAHSSSKFAISASTVGDGPPKDMSSRYPKARGEVNLRRAGWSGRQNNKGPNGSPLLWTDHR